MTCFKQFLLFAFLLTEDFIRFPEVFVLGCTPDSTLRFGIVLTLSPPIGGGFSVFPGLPGPGHFCGVSAMFSEEWSSLCICVIRLRLWVWGKNSQR